MRLIDADKLRTILTDEEYPCALQTALIGIINEQPTAYNVDKVVEELNKIKKYNLNLADMMLDIQANGTNRHFICLEDAIEIVKAGGRDER
jgi:hypothetical protein|nr:MAG TPA: hypothetical protein [Bacteriophage sp.]